MPPNPFSGFGGIDPNLGIPNTSSSLLNLPAYPNSLPNTIDAIKYNFARLNNVTDDPGKAHRLRSMIQLGYQQLKDSGYFESGQGQKFGHYIRSTGVVHDPDQGFRNSQSQYGMGAGQGPLYQSTSYTQPSYGSTSAGTASGGAPGYLPSSMGYGTYPTSIPGLSPTPAHTPRSRYNAPVNRPTYGRGAVGTALPAHPSWVQPGDKPNTPLYNDAMRFQGYKPENRWTFWDDQAGELRTHVTFNNGLAGTYGTAEMHGPRIEIYQPVSANPTPQEVAQARAITAKYAHEAYQQGVDRRMAATRGALPKQGTPEYQAYQNYRQIAEMLPGYMPPTSGKVQAQHMPQHIARLKQENAQYNRATAADRNWGLQGLKRAPGAAAGSIANTYIEPALALVETPEAIAYGRHETVPLFNGQQFQGPDQYVSDQVQGVTSLVDPNTWRNDPWGTGVQAAGALAGLGLPFLHAAPGIRGRIAPETPRVASEMQAINAIQQARRTQSKSSPPTTKPSIGNVGASAKAGASDIWGRQWGYGGNGDDLSWGYGSGAKTPSTSGKPAAMSWRAALGIGEDGNRNGLGTNFVNESAKNRTFTNRSVFTATRPSGTRQTYVAIQRNDMDWNAIRRGGPKLGRGLTNKDAAKRFGFAPELPDGSFATLHHVGQDSRGPLAEASTRYHGVGKYGQDILHSQYGRNQPHPDFPINRQQFDVDTREYWRWRAPN